MNELTLVKQDGGAYIDSREVAELIGKRHSDLLRDIERYGKYMANSIERKIAFNDFFLENTYVDSIGRTLPCFLLSKMGCEMVANKLTGEKGILFTAAYVTKFNQMEMAERTELEAMSTAPALPAPRLGEINACARIIVRGFTSFGATPEHIMEFLKETYEMFGINIVIDGDGENAPRWYTAGAIAKQCGLYSITGKPHAQAVSAILNENLFIGEHHKRVVTTNYGRHIGVGVYYDEFALLSVQDWLEENGYPTEVYGFEKTFYTAYKK